MRHLICALLAAGLAVAAPARAEELPPELVELFEQLGISLDENGQPTPPPTPPQPTPPPEPLTPEDLAELLGIPIELLVPNPDPTPPAAPPAPEPAPPSPAPDPQTLEELAELLGLPVGVLTGETPPAPPAAPSTPSYTPDDLEFWRMLGFDEIPGQPASGVATAAVPEPTTLLLLAIGVGLIPRRRR